MKKFSKIAVWAMSLAIASTATMSAYAEGEEEPIAPDTAVTAEAEAETEAPTEEETEAETEAPTEAVTTVEATEAPTEPETTSPAQTGDKSGIIETIEIHVYSDNSYSMRDVNTNAAVTVSADGVAKITGTVIVSSEGSFDYDNLTDEQLELIEAFVNAVDSLKITRIEYAESVTEVQEDFVDPYMVSYPLTITFGKNIKTINSEFFDGVTGEVTVYGYTGTAAEKYAKDGGAKFVSLGGQAAPTTTKAATTTKKNTATTTSKPNGNESPKTGDAGTVTGVLALAVTTFALSMKKRKNK